MGSQSHCTIAMTWRERARERAEQRTARGCASSRRERQESDEAAGVVALGARHKRRTRDDVYDNDDVTTGRWFDTASCEGVEGVRG